MIKSTEAIGVLKRKAITWFWLILLLLVPIVLWILPADFFDNSKVELCPSKLFFDVECFGCGITRAVMHLHHAEFDDAVYFNRGSLVIYPALILVWFIWAFSAVKKLGIIKSKNTVTGS